MLKDITLGQYFPGNSFIHRLDPRTKLIALVVYIVALFMAVNWVSYALMAAFLLLCIKILMCADEPLCRRIAQKLTPLGIPAERLIVTAIHTHSAPCGVVPGEGLMERIQLPGYPVDESYLPYLDKILKAAYTACCRALENLEPFVVRTGQGTAPTVGSERHGGNSFDVMLTALECRTESGRGSGSERGSDAESGTGRRE